MILLLASSQGIQLVIFIFFLCFGRLSFLQWHLKQSRDGFMIQAMCNNIYMIDTRNTIIYDKAIDTHLQTEIAIWLQLCTMKLLLHIYRNCDIVLLETLPYISVFSFSASWCNFFALMSLFLFFLIMALTLQRKSFTAPSGMLIFLTKKFFGKSWIAVA